ncbi:MAG: hypothetical protein MZV64_24300 [Ignavibacteriales bacterium]|nr:hypothetical protein [Ignavibacteriales bacterium]
MMPLRLHALHSHWIGGDLASLGEQIVGATSLAAQRDQHRCHDLAACIDGDADVWLHEKSFPPARFGRRVDLPATTCHQPGCNAPCRAGNYASNKRRRDEDQRRLTRDLGRDPARGSGDDAGSDSNHPPKRTCLSSRMNSTCCKDIGRSLSP